VGPWRPRSPALASGGIFSDVFTWRAGVRATVGVLAAVRRSVRPGAIDDTTAANPAVSAAVPAMTKRRVRTIRSNAASRVS
jgi:hypothetical protein